MTHVWVLNFNPQSSEGCVNKFVFLLLMAPSTAILVAHPLVSLYIYLNSNPEIKAIVTPRGGGSGYTLCTGDVPPSRVCFSQFRAGKGVVFRPNSLARGVFYSWFDTKILARVVILPFFLGRVGNFCLGRVRVCHPGLHTPIHNLVKSPPPPPGIATQGQVSDLTYIGTLAFSYSHGCTAW